MVLEYCCFVNCPSLSKSFINSRIFAWFFVLLFITWTAHFQFVLYFKIIISVDIFNSFLRNFSSCGCSCFSLGLWKSYPSPDLHITSLILNRNMQNVSKSCYCYFGSVWILFSFAFQLLQTVLMPQCIYSINPF